MAAEQVVKSQNKDKICFIIAPIGEPGSDTRKRSDSLIQWIIDPVLRTLGYTSRRSDQILQPGIISKQVVESILDSPLVIADLTGSNPNVFYEIQQLMIDNGAPTVFSVEQENLLWIKGNSTWLHIKVRNPHTKELAENCKAVVLRTNNLQTDESKDLGTFLKWEESNDRNMTILMSSKEKLALKAQGKEWETSWLLKKHIMRWSRGG